MRYMRYVVVLRWNGFRGGMGDWRLDIVWSKRQKIRLRWIAGNIWVGLGDVSGRNFGDGGAVRCVNENKCIFGLCKKFAVNNRAYSSACRDVSASSDDDDRFFESSGVFCSTSVGNGSSDKIDFVSSLPCSRVLSSSDSPFGRFVLMASDNASSPSFTTSLDCSTTPSSENTSAESG